MKTLITLFILTFFSFNNLIYSQNVTVNPGAGSYATLKAAFDAINAGSHTGTVTVEITNNTTETATAILENSGTGAANYSSVNIYPTGGAWTIQGSINGAIIKLNYADNVTIDGRIAGEGRNLTIKNTNSFNTNTAAIWLSSNGFGNVPGSSKNTIRNCEILCGTNTSTSTNETFGIFMGGNSITSVNFGGAHNDSNSFIENKITKCWFGIFLYAYTTNYDYNNVVQRNIIGATAFGTSIIGKCGIFTVYQIYCSVTDNEIQFIGGPKASVAYSTDNIGIGIEILTWTNSNVGSNKGYYYSVQRNKIHDIVNENLFSAAGILLGSSGIDGTPTNNLVANNEIYNIRSNGTALRQLVGIGITGGGSGGDKIIYNSIYLTGDVDPAGSAATIDTLGGGIIKKQLNATDSGLTIANNTITLNLNQNNEASRTKTKYCIITPVGYNWGSGGIYNNNYYTSGNADMMTGGKGITNTITTYITLANWKTAYSPLQDTGSVQVNPQHSLNASNYLLLKSISTLFTNAKPMNIVTSDIMGFTRSINSPTIGAYEKDTTVLSKVVLNFYAFIEGFYDNISNQQVSDTIKIILKNNFSPYNAVDSAKSILSSFGTSNINFPTAPTGTYYLVLKHRNSIETWSKSGGQSLTNGALNIYNFTDLITKAYGNNIKQIDALPYTYGSFSGDENQDGNIDVSDIVDIYNDGLVLTSGYVKTDINGDDFVDVSDLIITYNNLINIVTVVTP